jgi:hypothetical protein
LSLDWPRQQTRKEWGKVGARKNGPFFLFDQICGDSSRNANETDVRREINGDLQSLVDFC